MRTLVIIFAVIVLLMAYYFAPPGDFPIPRTEFIPQELVQINNDYYNEPDFANHWLDANGWAQGLHAMNPARVSYVYDRILEQFKVKDSVKWASIGCGGAILEIELEQQIAKLLSTEEYKNKKFALVGIDQGENSIATANKGKKTNMTSFLVGSAYKVPLQSDSYDGVIIADVLEHLNDLPTAIKEIHRILNKEKTSTIVFDTIDRSFPAYAALILVGEGMGAIPVNTHDYRLFIKPSEMQQILEKYQFEGFTLKGLELELGTHH